MKTKNYSYSFATSKPMEEVFRTLLDVRQWWSGLYEESIQGESRTLDDAFTFKAGGGAHYSAQKLIELVPGTRVAWLVTDSRLSFLKDATEWNGTKIRFDLSPEGNGTRIIFTHEGLVPQIECYEACSGAWTGYLDRLKKKLENES